MVYLVSALFAEKAFLRFVDGLFERVFVCDHIFEYVRIGAEKMRVLTGTYLAESVMSCVQKWRAVTISDMLQSSFDMGHCVFICYHNGIGDGLKFLLSKHVLETMACQRILLHGSASTMSR